MRQPRRRTVVERIVDPPRRRHVRRKQVEQRRAIVHPVQPSQTVQRLARRQRMSLAIVDHLDPVLDRPQQRVAVDQRARIVLPDPARLREPRERGTRRRRPQCRIAAAMDQLVDLREEFGLANAAPAAFQVIARAECLPLRMVIANAPRDAADLAEVERAPPDKGPHRIEEPRPQRDIPRRRPRANERRALPGQRLRLVIADRRADRQRDRRDLGRRPQAKIDPQHIAVPVTCLQQLDDALRYTDRRAFGLLARPPRQGVRIVDQDRVDIRRVVEFAAPLLAKRDGGKTARRRARGALLDRCPDRSVERIIGKARERARDGVEIEHPR